MITSGNVGDIANAAIALLALVVSLVSFWKTTRFNERQNELAETTDRLNRLLIDREAAESLAAKRADLSANLYEAGRNRYRLKVFNRGKGVARNVRLVDLDAGNETLLMASDIDHKFPVPILEQHQSVELIAAVHIGSKLRSHIRVVWDDDAGHDQQKELTPTL